MGNWFTPRDIHPALWAFLAAVIIITGVYSVPRILGNLQGYQELFQEVSGPVSRESEQPEVHRALLRFENGELQAVRTDYPVRPSEHSRNTYDRLLSALFSPPTLKELEHGYFTAIPEDAAYLGSRTVRSTLYIKLSKEFFADHPLGEAGYEAAVMQIRETLHGSVPAEQFLLIHGDEIMLGPVPLSR